jgi:hypothetical protein
VKWAQLAFEALPASAEVPKSQSCGIFGTEDEHELRLCRGWYFSKARPAAEVERILAAFRDRSTNAPSLDPMQLKEFLNPWMKKTA